MKYVPGILLALLLLSLPQFVWAEDETAVESNGEASTTQTDTNDTKEKGKEGEEEEEEEPDCE